MPKVYNKFHRNEPEGTVYVGRPSSWGNPFSIGVWATREEVIEKYRLYLDEHPELIQQAKDELVGKDLSCWCAPKACHADVLMEIANG